KDVPYQNVTADCSAIVPEEVSFSIGDTPFAFDFEPGKWPEPYTNEIFVPLHGEAGDWAGARIVAIATDPVTGKPTQSSTINGNSGGMSDFAVGWDDGSHAHGRPATIVFASDGRMFLGNDNDGTILWVAPLG